MGVNPNAPSWAVPILDGSGQMSQPWFGYLSQLGGVPGPIRPVTVVESPFTYKAPYNGSLAISGGTVSAVTISRARVSNVPLGLTSGCVAVAANDLVTIVYSAVPTINFIPT